MTEKNQSLLVNVALHINLMTKILLDIFRMDSANAVELAVITKEYEGASLWIVLDVDPYYIKRVLFGQVYKVA